MKATWYSRNGEARDVLQVGELPDPQPGPGEVRVRLATSGVNPSDVKSRRGRPLGSERVVPHSDGAGVVDAVGAGVSASRIGQRVWIWNGQWQRPMGTACEAIALPEAQAVELPGGTGFDAGACLGIPALTAVQAVHLAGPLAGRDVLVTGAGNAVGHYVTQLATQAGARVIGTVGGEAKAAHARAAGAVDTIDYKHEPVAERVKALTQGRGVDVLIDMDFSSTARLLGQGVLRPHGQLVCYGSNDAGDVAVNFRTLLWSSLGLKFFLVYELSPADRSRCVAELQALLSAQRLRHSIGARFSLDQIAAAHEAVEAGREIGNVLINL
jgi:NADPH2:quinone reductase